MERLDFRKKFIGLFGKYKYAAIILCIGILMMLLPESVSKDEQHEIPVQQNKSMSPTENLENILGQIAGVGKVKVLITEANGAETVYQTDENRSVSQDSENLKVETVIVNNANREETGLIRFVSPPVYLGAIIVCDGGDSPTVKLSIVQAVSNVTGIPSDRIAVLKMK